MESVIKIAAYISSRYKAVHGVDIDEMKLHKLLYFAQRESLARLQRPLFEEEFQAWKYGPVLVQIRDAFRHGALDSHEPISPDCREILDFVIDEYSGKSSWSLSRITHGEFSWQNARRNMAPDASCANVIPTTDIAVDAERIRNRRLFLEQLAATHDEDN